MEKIFAIYCGNSSEEEVQNIQTHFFREGIEWYSAKYKGENKYKKKITDYIIVEDKNLFEGNDAVLNDVADEVLVVRFNSPVEFLRHYKIKKLTTKM